MIVAHIKKSDNSKLEIEIPEYASEVTYSKALDFLFAHYSLLDFLKEKNGDVEQNKIEYIKKLISCLNVFYDKIADFYEVDASYFNNIDLENISNHFATLNKKYKADEAIDSLTSIYNLIYKVISDAEGKINYSDHLIYKGIKYMIPTVWENAITEILEYNSITVRQAIAVQEAQAKCAEVQLKIAKDKDKEAKENNLSEDQQNAEAIFVKSIFEISVLLMAEGEIYPSSDQKFDKHIAEKMQTFIDIDYQSVLDIQKWWEGYDTYLKNKKENHYFFNMDHIEPTIDNRQDFENYTNAKKKNKDIEKNIGYKSILSRILELKIFSGLRQTEIESALEAPYSDAVTHISINNAK